MATIATRAILNNRNLTGAEINVRESVASFCATYAPYTETRVKDIAERIGMDNGQCSTVLTSLEKKGEIKRQGKAIYLVRLDDYQIETIAVENYELLETLSSLGCAEARHLHLILTEIKIAAENPATLEKLKNKGSRQASLMIEAVSREIENNSEKIESDSTSTAFLLHFFLFSKLSLTQLRLNHTQPDVESYSNLNESDSIALKEDNVLKSFSLNVFKDFLEETEQSPVQNFSFDPGINSPTTEDSDESPAANLESINPKTEVPPSGEGTNGKTKTEVPPSGEGKSKSSRQPKQSKRKTDFPKKSEETLTRKDIPDDADWLVWLKDQTRFSGIDVLGKYRDMLDWCGKNKKTPSRLRLVNWLNQERGALPMKTVEVERANGNPKETVEKFAVAAGERPPPLKLSEDDLRQHYDALKNDDGWIYRDDQFTEEDWSWLYSRIYDYRMDLLNPGTSAIKINTLRREEKV